MSTRKRGRMVIGERRRRRIVYAFINNRFNTNKNCIWWIKDDEIHFGNIDTEYTIAASYDDSLATDAMEKFGHALKVE